MTGPRQSSSRLPLFPRTLALAVLAIAGVWACGDSDALLLPAAYNTHKARAIVIDPLETLAPPIDHVNDLLGVDGAPLARHPELPDLRHAYWQRDANATDPDGAHVSLIRIGPSIDCGLALGQVLREAAAIRCKRPTTISPRLTHTSLASLPRDPPR